MCCNLRESSQVIRELSATIKSKTLQLYGKLRKVNERRDKKRKLRRIHVCDAFLMACLSLRLAPGPPVSSSSDLFPCSFRGWFDPIRTEIEAHAENPRKGSEQAAVFLRRPTARVLLAITPHSLSLLLQISHSSYMCSDTHNRHRQRRRARLYIKPTNTYLYVRNENFKVSRVRHHVHTK